jgi:hypothetical protein
LGGHEWALRGQATRRELLKKFFEIKKKTITNMIKK